MVRTFVTMATSAGVAALPGRFALRRRPLVGRAV